MELIRKKNQNTQVVFPLISLSASPTYHKGTLSNVVKTIYYYNNDTSAPVSGTIGSTPTQLDAIGLWYLTLSAAEMSSNYNYMSIKLSATEILEQTILVMMTDYNFNTMADTNNLFNVNSVNVSSVTNGAIVSADFGTDYYDKVQSLMSTPTVTIGKVQVSGIDGGVFVGTSAYTNLPSVNVSSVTDGAIVSADFGTDYYDKVQSLMSAPTVTIGKVQVSGIDGGVFVGTSAYTNFPQVTVSANLDKIDYAISGTKKLLDNLNDINGTAVTATAGTINNVTNPVVVSGYTNFPQVSVSANSDKTGYTVTAGTINNVSNSVIVSGYTNFPQVTVSANLDKIDYAISGTKKLLDNLNDINGTAVTATAGTINNVTNPVVVSGYTNFPQVTVSANLDKINYSISGTKKLLDNLNDINGTAVTATAGTINNITNSVVVSGYTNFPSVNVSSVTNGAIVSADFGTDYYDKVQSLMSTPTVTIGKVQVSGIDGGVFVGTSAYTNFPKVQVSGVDVGVDISATATIDYTEIYNSSISAIDDRFTFSGTNVNAYVVNEITATANVGEVTVSAYKNFPQVSVSANNDKTGYTVTAGTINNITNSVVVSGYTNFPSVNVSSVTNGAIVSADFGTDYYDKIQSLPVTGKVQVSGIDGGVYVGTSAYTNFPQVSVTANSDKTGYTVTAGTINNISNSVVVSGYTNFPQVTVSANLDKINYSISGTKKLLDNLNDINGTAVTATAGTINNITNSVVVSGYTNFPSVNVSSVTDGAIVSADFGTDYYNRIQSLVSSQTIGKVQVSGIDGGVFVGTSAYTNFPQVTVSANLDKINYSISGTKKLLDNLNDINGTAVTATAGTINNVTNPVVVSAYTNFPSVNVSSVTDGAIVSADFGTDYYDKVQSLMSTSTVTIGKVQVSGIDGGVFVGTSAYTNFPQVQVSGINAGIDISATATVDYTQVYSASVSAIDQRFTFSGDSVKAYTSGSTDTQSIVDAIFANVVDTKTFEEILTYLMAMAKGKITRSNNNFTYYAADGTTALYTLESNRNDRTPV